MITTLSELHQTVMLAVQISAPRLDSREETPDDSQIHHLHPGVTFTAGFVIRHRLFHVFAHLHISLRDVLVDDRSCSGSNFRICNGEDFRQSHRIGSVEKSEIPETLSGRKRNVNFLSTNNQAGRQCNQSDAEDID